MAFHIKNVRIEITFLFFAMISFVISLKAPANVLITIFSSFLHEIGHLVFLCQTGNYPQCVRLELTGINIIRNIHSSVSIRDEIVISLGGPAVNGFVFAVCCIILVFTESVLVLTSACVNLILMIFNLLPVKRLDGGAILYYLLSSFFDMHICTKILNIVSAAFIFLIYLWGFYVFVCSGYNISVIIIAIFLTASMFTDNEY